MENKKIILIIHALRIHFVMHFFLIMNVIDDIYREKILQWFERGKTKLILPMPECNCGSSVGFILVSFCNLGFTFKTHRRSVCKVRSWRILYHKENQAERRA